MIVEKIKISVVIPVYNEQDNLPQLNTELHESLIPLGEGFEIVYVNDGSKDNSQKVLSQLSEAFESVRVLVFERNCGQTAAFSAGFRHSRGEYVITLDADLQNSPSDIPAMLAYLPEYDVVCGVRKNRRDTIVKRISSRIANAVRNKITRDQITDTGCSLKVFKKEYLDRITLFEGMHRFFPTLLKMQGANVIEVAVSHHPRTKGVSKYNVWNRALVSLLDCLFVRWMQERKINYKIRS